jgi:4'-phosphopantetheinyl transferase
VLGQSLLWNHPPDNLVLSSQDVHVWRAELEQPTAWVEKLSQTLSEDEQIRAKRFYYERDRKHFIVGRGLLRTLLSRYVGIAPEQLRFCYSSRGKPSLVATGADNTIQFNLSHSHGLALYAVTFDRQIGVDLEYIRSTSDVEKLAQRFFSARESAIIHSLPPEQKQIAFFHAWTCKEAYLKATGEGIAQLEQVEVSLELGEPPRLLSIKKDCQPPTHWRLQALTPGNDYMAALAVEGQDWHLDCWAWQGS